MNKQELKEMLDFAGVDTTKGKAKALIEAKDSDQVTCPECHGKGMTRQSHEGEMEWDHCPTCDGKKTISKKAAMNEGWGAAGQKRQQDEMGKEAEKHREEIKQNHPDASKAFEAWLKRGFRGEAAAKRAIKQGMPQ